MDSPMIVGLVGPGRVSADARTWALPALARRLAWLALTLGLALTLAGCANPEFEQVRGYKEFLGKARPQLQAMNKVRQELYEADDIDAMLTKFDTGLLVNIEALRHLADTEKAPEGKLGELHGALRKTMDDYVNATAGLVKLL